jgi:hypothetical protein
LDNDEIGHGEKENQGERSSQNELDRTDAAVVPR